MPVHIQNRKGGALERSMRTLVEMRARGESPDVELQRAHDQYRV